MKHFTVLKDEAIKRLDIKSDGIYIDATLGLGGHALEIAPLLKSGKLICFDLDEKALTFSKKRLSEFKNIFYINENFKNLKQILDELKIKTINGIIYDLGTSYYQLTDQNRGFTYQGKDVELDMRMNQNLKYSAKDILNHYSKEKLTEIFWKYGDEKYANKIASEIVKTREVKQIKTNTDLNEIIKKVKGFQKNKHASKQVYQALRIEVNDEINSLKESLIQAANLLKKDGRIVVITFHSLEDRTVKNIFWELKNIKVENVYEQKHKFRTLKTVYPAKVEVKTNNPSRSAKLRTLVKNYE